MTTHTHIINQCTIHSRIFLVLWFMKTGPATLSSMRRWRFTINIVILQKIMIDFATYCDISNIIFLFTKISTIKRFNHLCPKVKTIVNGSQQSRLIAMNHDTCRGNHKSYLLCGTVHCWIFLLTIHTLACLAYLALNMMVCTMDLYETPFVVTQ